MMKDQVNRRFIVYFLESTEREDYSNRKESTQRTCVIADNAGEAERQIIAEYPEAYIKDIVDVTW